MKLQTIYYSCILLARITYTITEFTVIYYDLQYMLFNTEHCY